MLVDGVFVPRGAVPKGRRRRAAGVSFSGGRHGDGPAQRLRPGSTGNRGLREPQ